MKRRCDILHRVIRTLLQIIIMIFKNYYDFLGASTARVCRHSPYDGGEPCDWSEGALLPRKSPALPYVHRIDGHHHNGEPGA